MKLKPFFALACAAETALSVHFAITGNWPWFVFAAIMALVLGFQTVEDNFK